MDAADVLMALRRKYPRAAIVPEVVVDTDNLDAIDLWQKGDRTDPHPPMRRRIDALMFDGGQRTAIEVKVSRADVKRETFSKTYPFYRITHRFIYAVPAGLIDPHDMAWTPSALAGCGIWWVHDDGHVEVVRKANINKYPEPLPNQVITALAYRAAGVALIEGDQA